MPEEFKALGDGRISVVPGDYYLGDPCLLMDDDSWQRLLDSCGGFQASAVGVVDGYSVVAFHTEYGDGVLDTDEGELVVESGLVGLVPAAAVRQESVGTVRLVIGEGETCQKVGSNLYFGQIECMTGMDEDEEDADEDDIPSGPAR